MATTIAKAEIARQGTRRPPQQRRARQKYDAILRAAIRVLAEEGYSGASTVKIACAAGVGVGTVYDYFSDKDAIFRAYVDARSGEIFDTIATDLAAMRFHSVEEAVRAAIDASVLFTINNKESLSAMVGKIPGVYDGAMLRDAMQRLYVVAERFYRMQGLADDPKEAQRMTYILSNAVAGFFIRVVTDPELPLNKQEISDGLIRLVMGFLERGRA